MGRRHGRYFYCITLLLVSFVSRPAAADTDLVDLELTLPVGVVDRSTTGTTAPAGYGYDNQTGLLTGLEARLYSEGFNRYARVGVVIGARQQAGPLLGLDENYSFRTTILDAGVGFRTIFPCMSDRDLRWHLTGILGMVGVHADAGEGVGGEPNGSLYDERRAAADDLDHVGLGWRFGIDLSAHVSHFIVGLGLGVRQYFGIDTMVSRGWIMDLGLRIGGRIDLGDHPFE